MAGKEISIIHYAEMWPATERERGSRCCSWLLRATLENYSSNNYSKLQHEEHNDDMERKN